MGKHSVSGTSYWEARRRRKDLRNRSKPKKQKRRGPTKKRWFIIIFLIGVLVGGALGYFYKDVLKLGAQVYLSFKQKQWQPEGEQKEEIEEELTPISADPNMSVNTLVLGSDFGSNKGESGWCRSDVMMLVCLHERDKKAVVISIPRDTRAKIPGHGTEKINAAHSYGGPAEAIAAVKELLGMEIHHYVSMNFEGFKEIVDAIGGVPIHLNQAINDPHAGYLPAGDLVLNGDQALVIVRSRRLPGGDLDRIKSQHAFLKALINKAAEMRNVWKAKQMVDIVASTCQMDFSAGELTTLAEELRDFPLTNVQFVTIPGYPKNIGGASYFIAEEPEIAEMVAEVQANTEISPQLLAEIKAGESAGSRERIEQSFGPDADVVTVLAGSYSVSGLVPVVVGELTLLGHEQVFEGKSKKAHQDTTIYYREEATDNANGIKASIPELANADMVQDVDVATEYNSPVVIVLGSSFQSPPLYSIYGRIGKPAFDIENFGEKPDSFG